MATLLTCCSQMVPIPTPSTVVGTLHCISWCAIPIMAWISAPRTPSRGSSRRSWRKKRIRISASCRNIRRLRAMKCRSAAQQRLDDIEVVDFDVVKALLDGGADPKATTDAGHSALHMAAGGGTDVQRMRSPEERALAIK